MAYSNGESDKIDVMVVLPVWIYLVPIDCLACKLTDLPL